MTHQVDYIIVGQGIAGSVLAWFLHKAGKNVKIIDDAASSAAWRVSLGVCNPITGKNFVTTWKARVVFPFM